MSDSRNDVNAATTLLSPLVVVQQVEQAKQDGNISRNKDGEAIHVHKPD